MYFYEIDKNDILFIIKLIEPKIKKTLKETDIQNREDLEQDLKEKIIKKLKDSDLNKVPGFFEFLEGDTSCSKAL
jgi:hypothetical protein